MNQMLKIRFEALVNGRETKRTSRLLAKDCKYLKELHDAGEES